MKSHDKTFLQALQNIAKEQKVLMETSPFPQWFGPVNALVLNHALVTIAAVALGVSMVIFVLYFRFFFALAIGMAGGLGGGGLGL
ncbi:MAG: hypothetical protein A2804_01125 [Candidatus Pacebacteria bacterium RIFCSPHIGHO2_01_FULL_46_10]|nr:MAG: hypothetical protein A2804_01125 [Candidatus Pacebacteria bacterium RIFCSPHIGHO2_01_FULL_46_10]